MHPLSLLVQLLESVCQIHGQLHWQHFIFDEGSIQSDNPTLVDSVVRWILQAYHKVLLRHLRVQTNLHHLKWNGLEHLTPVVLVLPHIVDVQSQHRILHLIGLVVYCGLEDHFAVRLAHLQRLCSHLHPQVAELCQVIIGPADLHTLLELRTQPFFVLLLLSYVLACLVLIILDGSFSHVLVVAPGASLLLCGDQHALELVWNGGGEGMAVGACLFLVHHRRRIAGFLEKHIVERIHDLQHCGSVLRGLPLVHQVFDILGVLAVSVARGVVARVISSVGVGTQQEIVFLADAAPTAPLLVAGLGLEAGRVLRNLFEAVSPATGVTLRAVASQRY